MSTVTVTLTKNAAAPLPAGSAAFAATLVTLTDSAGTKQTATVNGTETPPWVAEFDNVANTAGGSGSVTAQDQDASGVAIGSPVTQLYNNTGVAPATFPQTTAISVSVAA